MIRLVQKQLSTLQGRIAVLGLLVMAAALSVPALAAATETEAQTKVKTIAESVASEGIAIFLIVVGAIGTLFALLMAVVIGFKKIKTLVK